MATPAKSPRVNIGLTDEQRKGVVDILTRTLSDEYLLYTKTRNYHWNVVGPQFNDLHKFFEAQYDEIDRIIDEVAERIRQLGANAPATLAEFSRHTRLVENPGEYPDARAMIENLRADHETTIRYLRSDLEAVGGKYSDMGTNDFLTGLMEIHEKMAWMLRSYLEGPSVGHAGHATSG